jgi:hypothetical protein
MPFATNISPARSWSVEAFAAFWADPTLSRAQGVRAVITDDIVGYWPRPIGVVRGAAAYYKVIESVLTAGVQRSSEIGLGISCPRVFEPDGAGLLENFVACEGKLGHLGGVR